MLAATGRLRGRLRDMVAARPALARLAEVDAAMEQVLAPREHALLSSVPDLMAAHFERMGVKPVDTAIAATSPQAIASALAAWRGAVDEVVLRAIVAKDTVEDHLTLLRAC